MGAVFGGQETEGIKERNVIATTYVYVVIVYTSLFFCCLLERTQTDSHFHFFDHEHDN